MKKSVLLLLTVMLCLVLSSCEGNISEDSANTLVFEAPVKSSRISEFMESNPYFNPYNTLTDCDGEYIYQVQTSSRTQETGRGIYLWNLDGTYSGERISFVPDISWLEDYTDYDFFLSVDMHDGYVYFTQNNDVYRRSLSDGRIKKFNAFFTEIGSIVPCYMRIIDDVIFVGMTDGSWRVCSLYTPAWTDEPSLHSNPSETFSQQGLVDGEFCYNILRRPWCELLPEHLQFRRYYPDGNMLCVVSDNKDEPPVRRYGWNDTDSFVLVDYSAQFIYRIERTNDYSEPRGDYTVQLIDLNGEEYASVNFSVPVFDNILWSNTCDGKIYGCTERGQLVVYSIPDDELTLSEKREVNGSIDVTNGLVFYRSDYGVVNIWNPNDRATEE